MPRLDVRNTDRSKPESTYLLSSARKVYSQLGEEGIIEKIFEILGHERDDKWCVEFGAWDGVHLSNTCLFIRERHWHAVQVEANEQKHAELEKNFAEFPRALQVKALVGYTEGVDTIDHFLAKTPIPKDFDFISIDVDGNDWHIWESMRIYRPRVVVIEFNPKVPNDVFFIQDRDTRTNQGCSLLALIELGKQKGYELVCAHRWNAFFCVAEEFEKFGIADNTIDAMLPNPVGRIFECFDGTIYNTLAKPMWRLGGAAVTHDTFQLLEPHERVYKGSPFAAEKRREAAHHRERGTHESRVEAMLEKTLAKVERLERDVRRLRQVPSVTIQHKLRDAIRKLRSS